MGIGLLGFLFYDLVFIVVAKYSAHLPGGYWNLIWGNLVEGCLGGPSPFQLADFAAVPTRF